MVILMMLSRQALQDRVFYQITEISMSTLVRYGYLMIKWKVDDWIEIAFIVLVHLSSSVISIYKKNVFQVFSLLSLLSIYFSQFHFPPFLCLTSSSSLCSSCSSFSSTFSTLFSPFYSPFQLALCLQRALLCQFGNISWTLNTGQQCATKTIKHGKCKRSQDSE